MRNCDPKMNTFYYFCAHRNAKYLLTDETYSRQWFHKDYVVVAQG